MNAKTADIKRIVAFAMKKAKESGAAGNQKKHKGGLKMQEILLSLHSEYWDLIKSGKITYEVKKKRPRNISFPFRVFVYVAGGVGVVGKFDCDHIIYKKENMPAILANGSCLTESELIHYSRGRRLCGWHVQEGSVCEYETPIPLEMATGLKRPPASWCYLRKTE